MLNKLKKRLLLIFIILIMGIFSIIFCLLIYSNLLSERKSAQSYFQRISSITVFDLENTMDYKKLFSSLENDYKIGLIFCDSNNSVLYQSTNIFSEEMSEFTDFFFTIKSNEEIYVLTNKRSSTQSGIYEFTSSQGNVFYGISCDIININNELNYLYLIQKENDLFSLLKPQIMFYSLVYIVSLFSILLLSKYIICKAIKPAEVALQSQKNFIASASHELKAPLSVIIASAEDISSYEALPPEYKGSINAIDEECQRMSKLIEDLLLLTSIDTHTWSLNRIHINVDSLIVSIYEKFEPICRKKNIHLLILFDDIFPPFYADINRISQLLSIFIDNAISYSNANSEITLKAHVHKNRLIFSVIDHGPGITDDNKPFIYDRFYCAEKSRTKKNHYGLGLSIALELASMQSGKILLSDTPGGGCTFQVFFNI